MTARTYLLASLSSEFSNKVAEIWDDADIYSVVWLQILKSTASIKWFEDLKGRIKVRFSISTMEKTLNSFLPTLITKDTNECTTAGKRKICLEHVQFLLAGGSANKAFLFLLRSVEQKFEQALLGVGFKENGAGNVHVHINKLTYKDIWCTHAKDTYRVLFDEKQ